MSDQTVCAYYLVGAVSRVELTACVVFSRCNAVYPKNQGFPCTARPARLLNQPPWNDNASGVQFVKVFQGF